MGHMGRPATCAGPHSTPSYESFNIFLSKFDSYLKIYPEYHFFCYGLLYQYKFFKNNLNLTMFAQIF